MRTIDLEACIKALDEMILRHQKLNAHIQKGGNNEDASVCIDVGEVQALLRLCLDTLKRHVPEDSELLKDWHIEKHAESAWGFTILASIDDLVAQNGKLKAFLSVAKHFKNASTDNV
jgi:hypothetical protein